MATNSKKLGEVPADNLIVGYFPPVENDLRTIRKLGTAATLKRGTLMAKSSADGKLVVLGSEADVTAGSQKFNGDGTAKVFTVTDKPATLSGVKVGGEASTDWTYDASTGKITFGTAPAAGTNNVEATYTASEETLTPDCVLADDIEVGTASDVKVTPYVRGCFNMNKCEVAEGYTVSASDIEQYRLRSIEFRYALPY